MPDKPTPIWQPISALPLVVQMIDEPLDEAETQLKTLKEARHRPYVLDDGLLQRVQQVYSEQAEFIPIYHEQLVRWEIGRAHV